MNEKRQRENINREQTARGDGLIIQYIFIHTNIKGTIIPININ